MREHGPVTQNESRPRGASSVRRFAALDMHGLSGSPRRRRLITAEFMLGTVALWLFAALLLYHGSPLWGLIVLGVGLNYACLAICAVQLFPAGRLERQVEGVDLRAEARRYTFAQLLLLVPGLVLVVFVAETLTSSRS